MTTLVSELPDQPWRRRLFLPAYMVSEAARYARVSSQTVADWHRAGGRKAVTLSNKEKRAALSYMQLIEVAVVAAFREAGVALEQIRIAREYVHKTLQSEHPFAEYRFKKEGKRLLLDYEQVEGKAGRGKYLDATQGGQLVWEQFVSPRLQEFVYEAGGVAMRWHVAGPKSPIIIDPRISFGAPAVDSVPTWVIKGRWEAGESIPDIAADFGIKRNDIKKALAFEEVEIDAQRPSIWIH
ncbi:MAG TPA: DUF433 domain-containing protein [Stellaceae bacterium]|nr:DUF433 domain-containing protein [Stellaceae bacterium]